MMKKNRFPGVLLAVFLILSIVVSGLTTPGFLLPLVRQLTGSHPSGGATFDGNPASTDVSAEALSFTEGNSQPVSLAPLPGITLAAEANAMDKDRDISLTELSSEDLVEADALLNASVSEPAMMFGGWHLDAGLADDELLPGTFEMTFDLEEMGIPEEWYDAIQFYRVDDSGTWYEYATGVTDGKLIIDSRQNCDLFGAIAIFVVLGLPVWMDIGQQIRADANISTLMNGYDLTVDGKKRYRLIIDSPEAVKVMKDSFNTYWSEYKTTILGKKVLRELVSELSLPQDVIRDLTKKIDEGESIVSPQSLMSHVPEKYRYTLDISFKKRFYKRLEQTFAEEIRNSGTYEKIEKQYSEFNTHMDTAELSDLTNALEQVAKVEEFLQLAYFFLKDEGKCQMPTYKMEVQLNASSMDKAYGVALTPTFGNPYLVLYMKFIGSGSSLAYDRMLLTICHEMFHTVEREYVMYSRANYGFDEMLAQCVEWDAYEYFSAQGIITSSFEQALDNLTDCQYFAIPLDNYSTSYPEGKISNDRADVSYPRAPFFHYLMTNYGLVSTPTYGEILKDYKALTGHRYMTTIIKYIFLLDEQKLTNAYLEYATSDQDRFYKRAAENANSIAFPLLNVGRTAADAKLLNKNYTIRVRRVQIERAEAQQKQYALVLKYSENYREMMTDFSIIPMHTEQYGAWRSWQNGLFLDPRAYPDDVSSPIAYLMEVDGGTGKNSEGLLWNNYSGYKVAILTELPEPEKKIVDNTLQVGYLSSISDSYLADVVNSVVVTLRIGNTDVYREEIKYEGWNQPWTLDLSTLRLNGNPLTETQKQQLTFSWAYCVAGTYESGELCLGPETTVPLFDSLDLTGRWDMTSENSGVDMEWIRAYIASLPAEMSEMASEYTKYLDQMENSTGHFTMSVQRAAEGAAYEYDVSFIFDADPTVPYQFTGAFDESTMVLTLEPAENYMFSDTVRLVITASEEGLIAEGSTSYESQIITYSSKYSGKKIDDGT